MLPTSEGGAVASAGTPTPAGAAARLGRAVKRSLDVAAAASGLLLLSPIMLAAAALVALEDGRPVLYRQRRVGRSGRQFELLKFRSMRVNDVPVEVLGQPGDAHPLLLRSGRVLRRLKVDELPQLLNVLRGEMSLVGPRPTIPEQVERYGPFERRRLLVRPGLTGWAQVNGNTLLSWPERIVLDVWYVDHWSLRLDVRILVDTISVVLLGERRNESALHQALTHANGTGRSRR
jgi:lipopolysaccharide/colanic/teichoic acid biosynthesis glycosyltransferase